MCPVRFVTYVSGRSFAARKWMSVKMKATLIALVVCLAPIVIVPIHRAHQSYHLSYSEVLYNLIVNHQFASK
jgi:hypothetical protein